MEGQLPAEWAVPVDAADWRRSPAATARPLRLSAGQSWQCLCPLYPHPGPGSRLAQIGRPQHRSLPSPATRLTHSQVDHTATDCVALGQAGLRILILTLALKVGFVDLGTAHSNVLGQRHQHRRRRRRGVGRCCCHGAAVSPGSLRGSLAAHVWQLPRAGFALPCKRRVGGGSLKSSLSAEAVSVQSREGGEIGRAHV